MAHAQSSVQGSESRSVWPEPREWRGTIYELGSSPREATDGFLSMSTAVRSESQEDSSGCRMENGVEEMRVGQAIRISYL